MEIILNDTRLAADMDQSMDIMDIQAFVDTFEYDIDQIYIDHFWNSIEKGQWLVVDYDMLGWMGYECTRARDNKVQYHNLLEDNFAKSEDYDIVSGSDPRARHYDGALSRNTIIVSADTFKQSLMMLRTDKAKVIRRYYLLLEKIFRDYMAYLQFVKDHNHEVETAMLRAQPETPVINIDRSLMTADKFVYIMTSKRSFDQCLFKIGRANNPQRRLVQHNCSSATDMDRMFYTHTIPCIDAISLERALHQLLRRYHAHHEWYKIPHAQLKRIVELVKSQQQALLEEINACIAQRLGTPNDLTIEQFEGAALPRIASDPESMDIDQWDAPVCADPAIAVPVCALCDTPMDAAGCVVCSRMPEALLARVRSGDPPSFHSTKHASLATMIKDEQYCRWLLRQGWFRRRPEYPLVRRMHAWSRPFSCAATE